MVSFDHRDQGTPEDVWQRCPQLQDLPHAALAGVDRAVIFAAHPDDETLGAGGLIHRLASQGTELKIVVATLGENSHPDSPTHTRAALAQRRQIEMTAAAGCLTQGRVTPDYLGLTDGGLTAEDLDAPVTTAVEWAAQGQNPLVIATWEHDGHTDHEVLGRVAGTVASHHGVRWLQYPIWLWHWGTPQDLPHGMVRVSLSDQDRAIKERACALHESQTSPLSQLPGDEVLLGPHVVAHFQRSEEIFIQGTPNQGVVFDRVHSESEDPWKVDSSAYERRKRKVLLASLPQEQFNTVLDIGCSTGALTLELARRSRHVTAVDASAVALERARARFEAAGVESVTSVQAILPDGWNPGWHDLDLVVVSESGYFCSPSQWRELLELCTDALAADGTLVLCHWRHPVEGWPLDGADVHQQARQSPRLIRMLAHSERDFELEMFTPASADSR